MAIVEATLNGGTLPPTKLGITLYTAYLGRHRERHGGGALAVEQNKGGVHCCESHPPLRRSAAEYSKTFLSF